MSEITSIHATIVATWALAVITVCLRFFARQTSKAGLWYDDWLIIPATLVATVLCFTYVVWIDKVFQEQWLIAALVSEISWTVGIWITKCSILAFYWRLFSVNRRSTRVIIWILASFVTSWGLATTIATILTYTYAYMRQHNPNVYFDILELHLGCTVPHMLIDLLLLGFPVPLIWRLHMHRSQKSMLTFIFTLGSFVTAVSIVRMTIVIRVASGFSLANYFTTYYLWTSVEVNISIICACLPSLRPILSFISEKLKLLRQRNSTHKRGSKLLMDMLPTRKPASAALPISGSHNWDDGPNSMLDSSAVLEIEARNPRAPELDAEAPGPHIVEAETVETILEMYSQRAVGELEGQYTFATEIQ